VNVNDLVPCIEQTVAFDLYVLSRSADCTGCYCLTNAAREVLYIGQARVVQRRLIQHFDSAKRSALTVHGRISLASWRVAHIAELDRLERGWLETACLRDGQLPLMNRIAAPV
jgi:hypothetical protein